MIGVSWEGFEDSLTPSKDPGQGRRNLQRWDAIALEEIDEAFVQHFGSFEDADVRIGTNMDDYRNRLTLYRQACVEAVQDVQTRRRESGLPEDDSCEQDIKSALAWPESPEDAIPLPFPTRAFVAWIFAFFMSIPDVVNEVSRLTLCQFRGWPELASAKMSVRRMSRI